jgi:hypothetical protein
MPTKLITFFNKKAIIGCDGKCDKAWGVNNRPKIEVDGIVYMKSDDELGQAPLDPWTREGGVGKPRHGIDLLNKWCCRECERCAINEVGTEPVEENLVLTDFSKRVKM